MYVADFYMGNFPMWQHRLNCRENASAFMYSIRLDIFSQKKDWTFQFETFVHTCYYGR